MIAEPLAIFFTAILRHGYMPKCFRDCVILPIPKRNKDTTCSQNYRPIALSSSLSKVLERLILMKYESFFYSNSLQFGFKPGFSTTLCTATVKNVVSRYMHNGSYVLGCFLDASKAFDLVDHGVLFQTLLQFCFPGIVHNRCKYVGVIVCLRLSMYLLVFDRAALLFSVYIRILMVS